MLTITTLGLLHPIWEMMSFSKPFCKGYISISISISADYPQHKTTGYTSTTQTQEPRHTPRNLHKLAIKYNLQNTPQSSQKFVGPNAQLPD
jgi:hypothetical protein